MSEKNNPVDLKDDAPEEGILYHGNKIPKGLRWIYAAFGIWALFYLTKYVMPDLLTWLKAH